MLFTSYEFLGFIATLLLLYYVLPSGYQWPLLLAASYLFYFLAGGEYLFYILVTTITVYFAAWRMEQCTSKQKKRRFQWFLLCLAVNLGILAIMKYTNFIISNINGIFSAFGRKGRFSFVTLALPLGISFYTFQAIGYLIDVYRGTIPAEKNIFKFALFISFFPQLIQGPISRFGDLKQSLYKTHSFNGKTVCYGLQRMLWGYFKKLVIADRILVGVSTIISDTHIYHGAYVLVGMVFYTLELYADFTGGIDITIGLAETLGIRIQENFHRPYFSKSLKEYWRRWHISMCAWFRDYLFYPVSTSNLMQKFSKLCRKKLNMTFGKHLPVHLSSFIVWLATGIWHGASWNFIVWGLCNWFVLMVSQELEPFYRRFHKRFSIGKRQWYRLFQVVRTCLLVCCLNLFDCYDSLRDTFHMFVSIFTVRNWNILWNGSLLQIGLTTADYWTLVIGSIVLILVSLIQRREKVRDKIARQSCLVRFVVWYGLFLTVILMGVYGVGYDKSQFIYNQF